ncbi:orotidine-5'-phosphate decarboxylase [Segetibacter aerophilus]|uniref:Orotidine-5'-phosphate decarboxylase n=1 Tax=Segetibacter aerophilus TaxID=670293 RepID=A0A512BHG7_9BACT|nr:orotidine-5'-phosphate decarboxylase [Segetibacter aerophilus]GEO11267.1 orotidine 5'-phosphate decarboxylase [Segetibacter aerophilus]
MNRQELIQQVKGKKNYLCIGLDTDINKLPKHLHASEQAVFEFNKAIIDATKDFCVSYKINTAFYEAMGIKGWEALEQTVDYIPATHFKIADAKRGDIGNTSAQYAKTFFEVYNFDAVTVAPYMGEDSVRPFLEYENKWTIVLGLTSNKGSEDFQQLVVRTESEEFLSELTPGHHHKQQYLYEKVMQQMAGWGTPENLMFVVGATKAEQLQQIRKAYPEHFFLVPGVGSQGGSLAEVSRAALHADGGLLVNVSRAIIYAGTGERFAEDAKTIAEQYHDEMNSLFEEASLAS